MLYSKIKGSIWIFFTLGLGVSASLGLPIFARHIPWRFEKALAGLIPNLVQNQACGLHNPNDRILLQKVVSRLYPQQFDLEQHEIQIDIIKNSSVNAFAFLGGHIYVYEGLLKQADNAEELAGVISHEIQHILSRHVIQDIMVRLVTVGAFEFLVSGGKSLDPIFFRQILNMRFSREQENEADIGGLKRLSLSKIDLKGFQHFFEKIQYATILPEFMSDHPDSGNRAKLVASFTPQLFEPVMSLSEWHRLQKICD